MWFLALLACKPEVSFHQDVAPILDARCMQCHTAGGIAPMSFDTYEGTVEWAEAIVAATQDRTMPPKQVTMDGSCGDFQDTWWLSDDELSTLSSWVEAGTPSGKKVERNPPPVLKKVQASHTVNTPTFKPERLGTPGAEFDEYRCFPLDLEAASGQQYLTGFDVHPGNPALVHHVIGLIVDPAADSSEDGQTNAERMQILDAESPDRLGWPCFSGAGDHVAYESDPIAWAPGQGATIFPDGTGFSVPPGSILVAQVHYNLADASIQGQSDTTEIELQFTPSVDKEIYPLYFEFLIGSGTPIPAGKPAFEFSTTLRPSDLGVPVNINVLGVMPHMHGRGVNLDLSAQRGGSKECLIEVPSWDYNWQFVYLYDQPVSVAPTDSITLTCTYNTMGLTEDITGGWGTQNEMCLAVIYATL